MTVAGLLALAAQRGIARLDAQILLLQVLGRAVHDRAWLLAHDDDAVSPAQQAGFEDLLHRRTDGEPVAYLLGRREFHGLDLAVDRRVLVPRPDTETLVDWALDLLAEDSTARVLDLGTGSGAIALAIRHRRLAVQVAAVDASADALAVARANARRLSLDVDFRLGSWLDGIEGGWQLIVSNPPYIRADDAHLPDLRHEPRSALVAGADGLDDLRTIVAQAPSRLVPGGWLLLEHGWDQADAVRALLQEAGFTGVQSRHDLAGIARCTGGQRPVAG